jgi:hypothetical protein
MRRSVTNGDDSVGIADPIDRVIEIDSAQVQRRSDGSDAGVAVAAGRREYDPAASVTGSALGYGPVWERLLAGEL